MIEKWGLVDVSEATFDEAFNAWLEVAKHHKRSWMDDLARYNLYIKPAFGSKKLSWFTIKKIEDWHANLTKRKKERGVKSATIKPATANRIFALVSTVFGSKHVSLPVNPCKGVKKFGSWNTLKQRAGLTGIRLHDLRRTMGSYQAISGSSLAIIGKSLGHKTAQATQVYARLDLDPVRASMERAAALMLAAKDLSPKVVSLKAEGE